MGIGIEGSITNPMSGEATAVFATAVGLPFTGEGSLMNPAIPNLQTTVSSEALAPAVQRLEAMGIAPDVAQRMLSIQMTAGGVCVGTLGEYISIPDHEIVAGKFLAKVAVANERGDDLIELTYDRFDMFAQRDDEGNVVHAIVEPADLDSKKK